MGKQVCDPDEYAWTTPECGKKPLYYIVNLRYAVFDTATSVWVDNVGGYSLSVAAVDSSRAKMGLFTDEVFSESYQMYGVSVHVEGLPCVR